MLKSGAYLGLVFTLILTAAPQIGAQQNAKHVSENATGCKSLCQNQNLLGWIPTNMTLLGTIDYSTANIQTFEISNTVPYAASEILLYVWTYSGYCEGTEQTIAIFTENSSGVQYKKYVPIKQYPQMAVTLTSENMWFPLFNRSIYVKLSDKDYCGTSGGRLYVTGYR